MYDFQENEHQELFYLGIDPTKPIGIHIPSPLGPLGYFLFARVKNADVERLFQVSTRLDIDGLREDHLTVAPGEGVDFEAIIPSKVEGKSWRCLGLAKVSRGNGTLVFHNWPADITSADLLICTWLRFVQSGQADDWIDAQSDPRWAPSGVPLGGIGGGRVDICRDGRFRNFSMNNNQDAPLEDPAGLSGAYLSVEIDGREIDIASRPIVEGHDACTSLRFASAFPQAALTAHEIAPEVNVSITLSGSFSPHDLPTSAIPGFLVCWEIENAGSEEKKITCRLGWPNIIGIGGKIATIESGIGYGDGFYRHWDDPTGRAETPLSDGNITALRYTGTPGPDRLPSAGEHLIGVLNDGCTASAGDKSVSAEVTIPAGGKAVVNMALVAAMPHWVDSYSIDRGVYWQNHYLDGAKMLRHLLENAASIIKEAGALHAFLAQGSLPEWLSTRLANCCYPLVTNSVLYKDGRFSINEGPTEMGGCYGTIDQRLAAHPATQLLMPELNRWELELFANIQGENGGINHDLGYGHLERPAGEQKWPDLTCSFIIQTARHAWSTGDAQFEAEMWPRAKRALLRHAEWAEQGGGVAQVGAGLGTSYDGYHYIGTTGYMATLWLAALDVCEKWARKQGDEELLEKIPAWREAAITRLFTDLWNGEHFISYGDTQGHQRYTCHAGQIAGQVFTRLLCGLDVLDEITLDSCLNAIFRLNGSERFAVPPDEVAENGEAAAAFCWLPYVEGFMLTAAASRGDQRLWPLWERMMRVVDADGARPCDTRLMYRPGGDPSWGAYYMTAPASWLVYDAWLDFFFAPQEGILRLRATNPGAFPLIHPLFWAMAVIDDGKVSLRIERVFSESPLTLCALAIPNEAQAIGLQPSGEEGDYRIYSLPQPVELTPGAVAEWQVS